MGGHLSRPGVAASVSVVLASLLAGCFTTASDFRSDAESYIVESSSLRDALLADSNTKFTTATCTDPINQDVGTTFACTGTDGSGAVWGFEMTITGKHEYDVTVSRRPDGA